MLSGSIAFLIARITLTASPCSAIKKSIFPQPIPCSPVQVPSRNIARSTTRSLRPFGLRDLLWVVRVEHNNHVEVTVAGMADDRCGQKRSCHILLRLDDAFSKPRNWHTDIRRPELSFLPQGPICIGDVMTGAPKLGTILRLGYPGKIATAMLGGDHLNQLRLLCHAKPLCRGIRATMSALPASQTLNTC